MNDQREDCKYWDKCYQKNPAHIAKYNHPPKSSELESIDASQKLQVAGESNDKSSELTVSSLSSENNPKRSLSPSIEAAATDSNKRPRKSPSLGESSKEMNTIEDSTETNSANIDKKVPEESEHKRTAAEEREEMDITEEYNQVMRNLEGKNYFEIFQRRVRYSQKAEYLDLLKTPEFIRHKFLVEMPD